MKVLDLTMLKSAALPTIPESFFKPERVSNQKSRPLPVGTVVCIERHYHSRNESNPERVWGFVHYVGSSVYVMWPHGQTNSYLGGELCTLEEFISEYGNALPFSWRT